MELAVAGQKVYAYTGARALDVARPTVVFVHGAAMDHSVWTLQSRYFAHHGWNVLAVDLPAHGRSAGTALATVEALADWLPTVLDAAGIGRAAIVGHSLGALVALECGARHGERTTRVALVGPAIPMTVAEPLLEAARRDDHVAFELINGWSYSAGKQLGGNTVPGIWLVGSALRLMERTRPGVLHADLRACHGYAAGLDAAARLRCPALLIIGERDIMAPPKNARSLIAALADAQTVTLPDCGHALMAEQPDAVLDALRAFLL